MVSEDDSEPGPGRELIAPFLEDPRVRFVSTPARRNAAAHQTQLVRAGRAPYVAVLDDDDRWDPGFLERRVGFMERHPECAFVFSSSRVIDARGRELGTNDPRLEEGIHDGRQLIGHLLRLGNVVTSSSALVRRGAYGPDGSYDTGFAVGYDLEMWIRLAARSAVGFLDAADIEHRLHPGQVTRLDPIAASGCVSWTTSSACSRRRSQTCASTPTTRGGGGPSACSAPPSTPPSSGMRRRLGRTGDAR